MKLYFKALSVGMILVSTHSIGNASTALSDILPKASRMLRNIKPFSAASLSDTPVYIQKRNLHSTRPLLDMGSMIGKNVPWEQWEKVAKHPATSTTQKTKKIPQSKVDDREEPVFILPLILKDVLMGGSVTERVSSTPDIYQPKDKPVTTAVTPGAQEAPTINWYKTAGC